MTNENRKNKGTFCSFCNKTSEDVGTLVKGVSDVFICRECVELCQQIFIRERQKKGGEQKQENEDATCQASKTIETSLHEARRNILDALLMLGKCEQERKNT